MVMSPSGLGRKSHFSWRGSAEMVNDRPALSSERAPHIYKRATKFSSWAVDSCLTPRHTGRLNVDFDLELSQSSGSRARRRTV
jgi:hypothetical protein